MPKNDPAAAAAESRRLGKELATAFSRGVPPQPVATNLHLGPGEACFGQMPVTLLQWLEGDGGYMKHGGGYVFGGGAVGAVWNTARFATNVVGNSKRRKDAEREAAGAWRPVDQGYLYLTNRRFAITASQWIDLWYEHVRTSEAGWGCIRLQLSGMPATALQIPYVDYWYVMFMKLAFGRVVMPPDADGGEFRDITPDPLGYQPGQWGPPPVAGDAGRPPEISLTDPPAPQQAASDGPWYGSAQ
jgi:hypothetical protein